MPQTETAIPKLLESIVESMGDGVVATDNDGNLFVFNAAARRLVGESPVRPPQDEWSRHYGFYLPDCVTHYPARQLPLSRALRGETVNDGRIFVRNPHVPEGRWLSSTARPLCDEHGRIRGAVTVFRDITEGIRTEESIRRSERFYRLLFEKNVAGILHTSLEGEILACNDGFARMLGYAGKEELVGRDIGGFYFNPPDRKAMIAELHKTHLLANYEICFRRSDGTRAYLIADINALEPPPGEAGAGMLGTMIDVTDRKLWEDALRRSEQRFSSFMRHLPGIASIKDLSGRYVFINEASASRLQFSAQAMTGKMVEEIWPPEVAATIRRHDAEVMRTGRPLEVVQEMPFANGSHSLLMTKFPIPGDDGDTGFLGAIGIDITERRRLEEHLQQASKMEAVGRLAGGVAHDFNNLLTVISGYGQMVIDAIDKGSPVDRDYVEALLEAARRAAALTNQLLAFSRRQVIQPKVIDLNALVRNIQNMLERVIGEHIALSVETAGDPCMILADAGQIEQVMMNLAANARDAMPKRGTLEIRTAVLTRATGERVLLQVTDTGEGIDASTREHIFEPFFTSKGKGKGTGLGLSTVYGIVQQSGGEISVETERGRGTSFRITLPRVHAREDAPVPEPGSQTLRKGTETILLVEDESSVRQLVREMLHQQGYRVIEACDGREALQLYERHRKSIDLVLTDVIMPNMSGRELAERIAAIDPVLKLIYMSGYTGDVIAQHGRMSEDTPLLQKPFTPLALAHKLRELIEST